MQRIIVAGMAVFLASCGSDSSPDADVTTSGDEMTAQITTEDGVATLTTSSDQNVELPNGFAMYPGAKVVMSMDMSSAGGAGKTVMFETSDSPSDVVAFYRKQAEDAGIKIENEATINGTMMIGGKISELEGFTVSASPAENLTSAQIIIGKGVTN